MPRYVLPIFFVLAIGALVPLFQNSNFVANAETPGEKPKDGSSYVVGLNVGGSLHEGGFTPTDLNSADFIMGLMDALAGNEARLSQDQLKAAGEAFEKKLMARGKAVADENMAKAKAFLDENKKKDGVTTLPSGLQIVELKKGDGAQPKQTSLVKVHYEGKLINGKVFDSSVARGEPLPIRVNGVIPGWTEALQRMRVGDKWRLFIPPELGYGAQGSQGAIGPNEALIFEVELLDVQ